MTLNRKSRKRARKSLIKSVCNYSATRNVGSFGLCSWISQRTLACKRGRDLFLHMAIPTASG